MEFSILGMIILMPLLLSNNFFMSHQRSKRPSRTFKFCDTDFLRGLLKKNPLTKKNSNEGLKGDANLVSSKDLVNEEAAKIKASQAEIELLSMKTTNKNLEKEFEKMIKDYKDSNTEHLTKKRKINKKIRSCSYEIERMKQSMSDILVESDKTREEIREMRYAIENESNDGEEVSKISSDNIMDQIVVLKNIIDQLNNRLYVSENQIDLKNTENVLLKDTVIKLGNAIIENKTYKQDRSCHCHTCCLF